MTNPTPHGQVPGALIDLIDAYAETRHRYGRIHNARTEAARNAVIEALSGVQALSAAPNGWESVIDEARSGLQDSEPSTFDNSGYRAFAETVLAAVEEGLSALAASPTPPALSAAPEAIAKLRHLYQNMVNGAVRDTASAKRIAEGLLAPAIEALERATPPAEQQAAQVIIDFSQVGTAGPFPVANCRVSLPDATMQDLARMLRPTYAAEQAAQPGAVYAELPVPNYPKSGGFPGSFAAVQMRNFADRTHTLRKQAATKAEPVKACVCGESQASGTVHRVDGPCYVAAHQQEAQEPTEIPEEIERMAADRYKVVPSSYESMFHRWAVVAGTGTQQLYLGREVECQNMARKFAGAFLDGAFVAMQRTAPQPAPAPLSEQIDKLERKLAIIAVVGVIDGHDVVRRESVLEIARRAAIAAQGGE